ncbi:MAG: hypothetical protein Q8L48_02155 [Archangium sp.]|nr:hypothetical protein [Archangium sp.]
MESLPPKLEALIAAEADTDFGARTRMVSLAAGRAISAMGELDLIQYEEPEVDGSADLSMWEKVAPIIGSTISEVNTLCSQIDASFAPGELVVDPRAIAVDAAFQSAARELKAEVMNFGMRVRDPSVVGDRWNLITELQIFRFRFRDRIGKMVWEVATAFGECKRREVEPGYDEALASTLVVRAMTADLRRLMRVRIHKVSEAPAAEMLQQAQQMEKELNAFGRTAAWRALRAQDKKGILEFRANLRQVIAAGTPSKIDLLQLLEPFVEFVDGFGGISQREILVQHDQEVLAAVGVVLERAMNLSAYEERAVAFKEALDFGQTLYGRSPEFDVFLRNQRKGLPQPEVMPEQLEQFLVHIAGLSQY